MNNFNEIVSTINKKYRVLLPELTEQGRRLFAGVEALAVGWGGISAVACATGLSRTTVARGVKDAENPQRLQSGRIRKKGGGRKRRVETDPTLRRDLEDLLEPHTRGDPESPLRWTSKSLRKLAMELKNMGHKTSHRMVASLLREMEYSLQANRKTTEGKQHPDAMGNSSTSIRKRRSSKRWGSLLSRLTQKRKNWWVISRTPGRNGVLKAPLIKFWFTISRSRNLGKYRPMAFTIRLATMVGSALVLTTTRRRSR